MKQLPFDFDGFDGDGRKVKVCASAKAQDIRLLERAKSLLITYNAYNAYRKRKENDSPPLPYGFDKLNLKEGVSES